MTCWRACHNCGVCRRLDATAATDRRRTMTVVSSRASEPPAETPEAPLQRINAPRSFLHGFGDTAKEIWQYRELLSNLIRKELKVKYKDSVLGFVWSLLMPLV